MTVVYFTTVSEYDKVVEALKKALTFIEFSATWCPPCRAVAPYYEKYSSEYPKARFYKAEDTDEGDDDVQAVDKKAQVTAFPTFIAYRNGKEKGRFLGGNANLLKKFIEFHYSLED